MELITKFFSKLFPLNGLIGFNPDSLTAWWVLITFVIAGVSGFILRQRIKDVITAINLIPESPSISDLDENLYLKDEWEQYKSTFLETEGPYTKTADDATYYFNESSILSHRLSLRLWYSIPNILVGMGILGTFVGLTFGISNFRTESTDAIKQSIEVLLSGMGTAFATSIWGMLLSMLFSWYEKQQFNKANRQIRNLCKKLDQKFKLTKKDELSFTQKEFDSKIFYFETRLKNVLHELFVFQNNEGHDVLPAFVLRDLLLQSEQQSKSLKSFSSDLADGIMIANQTIESMGQTFADMIEQPFQNQFTPAVEKIEAAVKQLQAVKEESSGNMIQEVMSNLQDTLVQVSQDFQQTLSGSAQQSLENLAQLVGQAGSSLLSFPEQMNTVMNSLQAQSEKMQDHIHQLSESMQTQAEENTRRLREDTTNTAHELQVIISSMQDKMQSLIKEQAVGTQSVQQVMVNSREVLQNGQELMIQMQQTMTAFDIAYKHINSLSNELNQTSQNLHQSSLSLQTSTNQFGQQAQNFLEGNRQTLQQMESAFQEARQTAHDYSNRFQTIQSGLSQIFGEIEQGLVRYQNTTREKLNDSLSAFSQELSQAVSYLSGGIRELNEVVEEISDLRSKS